MPAPTPDMSVVPVYDSRNVRMALIRDRIADRESMVLRNVVDISIEVAAIRQEIESQGLTCRVYSNYRSAMTGAAIGTLWLPGINRLVGIVGLAAGVGIAAHGLVTYDPDYEIGKGYMQRTLTITFRR